MYNVIRIKKKKKKKEFYLSYSIFVSGGKMAQLDPPAVYVDIEAGSA